MSTASAFFSASGSSSRVDFGAVGLALGVALPRVGLVVALVEEDDPSVETSFPPGVSNSLIYAIVVGEHVETDVIAVRTASALACIEGIIVEVECSGGKHAVFRMDEGT